MRGELARDLDADDPAERPSGGDEQHAPLAAPEVDERGGCRIDLDPVEHPVRHRHRRRQIADGTAAHVGVVDAEALRLDGPSRVGAVLGVEAQVIGRLVGPAVGQQLVRGATPPEALERVADALPAAARGHVSHSRAATSSHSSR